VLVTDFDLHPNNKMENTIIKIYFFIIKILLDYLYKSKSELRIFLIKLNFILT
jgi:hypothetical protein